MKPCPGYLSSCEAGSFAPVVGAGCPAEPPLSTVGPHPPIAAARVPRSMSFCNRDVIIEVPPPRRRSRFRANSDPALDPALAGVGYRQPTTGAGHRLPPILRGRRMRYVDRTCDAPPFLALP